MQMETYRGFTIEARRIHPRPVHSLSDTQYMIYKGSELVCQQPSLEFARSWIDYQFEQIRSALISYAGY